MVRHETTRNNEIIHRFHFDRLTVLELAIEYDLTETRIRAIIRDHLPSNTRDKADIELSRSITGHLMQVRAHLAKATDELAIAMQLRTRLSSSSAQDQVNHEMAEVLGTLTPQGEPST